MKARDTASEAIERDRFVASSGSAYQRFVRRYLNAGSWAERKDGAPLEFLDALDPEEKAKAEEELIKRLSCWRDDWPIIGLGHMRSTKALPKLYSLLGWARGAMKARIATAIWKIAGDDRMLGIVIRCSHGSFVSRLNPFRTFSCIDIVYCLSEFSQKKAKVRLEELTHSRDYLISYNAKRALDLQRSK